MSGLVSVIMPSYNSKKFIERSIDSVISQTYPCWELLIVDDCSPDGSADYIKSIIKDDRIKLFSLEKNIGAACARNIAMNNSNGRYIAFLDSDDVWVSNKLEVQLEFMEKRKSAFSFSGYSVINENDEVCSSDIQVPETITYDEYLKNTIIGCLTVILDRKQVGRVQMPDLRSSHDMALWLDLLKKGFVADGCPSILARYRVLQSSNTSNKFKAAKDVWAVYRNYLKIGFFKSCYSFAFYVFNAVKKRV